MVEMLFGEEILRDGNEIETQEVCGFKEFMLVFYGAVWSAKSMRVAEAINNYMTEINPDDDNLTQSVEVLYLSNDRSRNEFDSFYNEMNENNSWCALNWNDSRLI